MELRAPIPFPLSASAAEDSVLTELEVAIAMVAGGVATRVRVAGLETVVADRVAGVAAARAGAAGLRFRVDRSAECATFTIGPSA